PRFERLGVAGYAAAAALELPRRVDKPVLPHELDRVAKVKTRAARLAQQPVHLCVAGVAAARLPERLDELEPEREIVRDEREDSPVGDLEAFVADCGVRGREKPQSGGIFRA